jgi:hypothetical protein
MRRAVLALTFGPLQARAAIAEAWHDNHASQGVSRALGYRPNGESLHRRGDGVDTICICACVVLTGWPQASLKPASTPRPLPPALRPRQGRPRPTQPPDQYTP